MITKPQIIHQLASNVSIDYTNLVAEEASKSPEIIGMLTDIMFHEPHPVNWRAAWIIDHAADFNRDLIEPFLEAYVAKLPLVTSNGVRRHLLRMMSRAKSIDFIDGNLINLCFEWLADLKTPIANKVFSMDILHRTVLIYPEMIPEFCLVLEDLLQHGSKGEKNRAGKLLQKLRKENKEW